jgi:hypothetical protein
MAPHAECWPCDGNGCGECDWTGLDLDGDWEPCEGCDRQACAYAPDPWWVDAVYFAGVAVFVALAFAVAGGCV